VKSDEFNAAWEPMKVKDWGASEGKVPQWLEETNTVGECRSGNGNGDGVIDQVRVAFEVDHGLEETLNYVTKFRKEVHLGADLRRRVMLFRLRYLKLMPRSLLKVRITKCLGLALRPAPTALPSRARNRQLDLNPRDEPRRTVRPT